MFSRFCLLIIGTLVFSSAQGGKTSDLEQEKLIAERLTERVKLGEPVWLKLGEQEIFSLYTEQNSLLEARGVLIILHSMGGHPDWPDVITHLRTAFPQQGWSTLSIQLPILAAEDPIEAYGETSREVGLRLKAAVEFLKGKDYENIVVAGYSFGAATAVQYLAGEKSDVKGLVGISMMAQPFLSPRLLLLDELAKLKTPVLDIYGSLDRDSIIEAAPDRRLSARKAENVYYKQIQIDGADHRYSGVEDVLIKRIRGWMDSLIVEMKRIEEDNEQDSE